MAHYYIKLMNLVSPSSHSPDGCPKLNPEDEDVVVLLPNTDPCPNPEL